MPRRSHWRRRCSPSRAQVVAAGKRFFYAQLERTTEAAYAMASEAITRNMLGPDAQEGVSAFVEKRKPRWND